MSDESENTDNPDRPTEYKPRLHKRKAGQQIRSRQEKAELIREISRLDRLGWSRDQIARKLNVAYGTVQHHLTRLTRRLARESIEDRAENIARRLDMLREVRKAAWEGFHSAKENAVRTIEQITPDKQCGPCDGSGVNDEGGDCRFCNGTGTRRGDRKLTTITTGRLATTDYLRIIMDTIKAERDLLGLDPIPSLNVNGNILMWDVLAMKYATDAVPDAIEQAIVEVEKLSVTTDDPPPPSAKGSMNRTTGDRNPVLPPDVGGGMK